jgi:hypothetical protein
MGRAGRALAVFRHTHTIDQRRNSAPVFTDVGNVSTAAMAGIATATGAYNRPASRAGARPATPSAAAGAAAGFSGHVPGAVAALVSPPAGNAPLSRRMCALPRPPGQQARAVSRHTVNKFRPHDSGTAPMMHELNASARHCRTRVPILLIGEEIFRDYAACFDSTGSPPLLLGDCSSGWGMRGAF